MCRSLVGSLSLSGMARAYDNMTDMFPLARVRYQNGSYLLAKKNAVKHKNPKTGKE